MKASYDALLLLPARLARLADHFDQLNVVGLLVIGFAEDYILLGCDVLNRLRILLDGPALTTEILMP